MSDRTKHQTLRNDEHLKAELLDSALKLFQQAHRQTWLPFVGASMFPYIKEGDMLLVKHARHSIRLGDVIVFKRAFSFIAHRVVFIKKHGAGHRGEKAKAKPGETTGRFTTLLAFHGNKISYRTKGDNLRSFDAFVPQSSVLGRVVRIQKNNRTISLGKLHARLFNLGLALSSYTYGILYQALKMFSGSRRIWYGDLQVKVVPPLFM